LAQREHYHFAVTAHHLIPFGDGGRVTKGGNIFMLKFRQMDSFAIAFRRMTLAALLPFIAVVWSDYGQASVAPCCGPISAAGRRLEVVLDSMGVESLWPAHQHVNWETGQPDKEADYEGPGKSTHCSAFAAAVSKKLGVYMLRPPEHGQILLANAQAKWFSSQEGHRAGWRVARDALSAQTLANQGDLVVVVYESPVSQRPGHIAIVRPSEKSGLQLAESGPQITQAGQQNYASTSVKIGFQAHAGAWPDGVRYYMHPLEP
jgi:hypothetical protein